MEARLRRFDGAYCWFSIRGVPLQDERGHVTKWYGTNTDIEDRKRAEEALREAQAQLAHVARLTTLGELTASIAHEINQPFARARRARPYPAVARAARRHSAPRAVLCAQICAPPAQTDRDDPAHRNDGYDGNGMKLGRTPAVWPGISRLLGATKPLLYV
jgi:hypothetical protein